jgi:hypothetical protein
VAITSEPEEHSPVTRKSSGYEGEAIIDRENKLVGYFNEKEMVHVTVSDRNYEFGMAQPAILVVMGNGTVLETWAIIPSLVGRFPLNWFDRMHSLLHCRRGNV